MRSRCRTVPCVYDSVWINSLCAVVFVCVCRTFNDAVGGSDYIPLNVSKISE